MESLGLWSSAFTRNGAHTTGTDQSSHRIGNARIAQQEWPESPSDLPSNVALLALDPNAPGRYLTQYSGAACKACSSCCVAGRCGVTCKLERSSDSSRRDRVSA